MSTRRQIYPVNRSALPQTRQRHEEHPTMPADISSRRPRPANHTSSLAPGLNNFSPHGNSVQCQSNATMDVWSGNYGLAPAYYANTYGSEMGMNYYYTLETLSDESSPANVPNTLQPNRAGSSRSDHRREPADIDLRRNKNYRPFLCEWRNCSNTTGFDRVECLRRHVLTQHVERGSFKCNYAHCNKAFNRKDNLRSHVQLVHISREGVEH